MQCVSNSYIPFVLCIADIVRHADALRKTLKDVPQLLKFMTDCMYYTLAGLLPADSLHMYTLCVPRTPSPPHTCSKQHHN